LEHLGVGQHRGIERHLDRLRVAGAAAAYLAVARRATPARVAGHHTLHAAQALEYGLEAPETPTGQRRGLESSLRHDLLRRQVMDSSILREPVPERDRGLSTAKRALASGACHIPLALARVGWHRPARRRRRRSPRVPRAPTAGPLASSHP